MESETPFYICKNSIGRFQLYTPNTKNGKPYIYFTSYILEWVIEVGVLRFGEITYNGKIITEKSFYRKQKLNNIWKKNK
jgi:hypothetical protein